MSETAREPARAAPASGAPRHLGAAILSAAIALPGLAPREAAAEVAPDHGLIGLRVTAREQVEAAVERARATSGTVLIDFRVEQEDSVYPMVPSGAALHDMIRRPLEDE